MLKRIKKRKRVRTRGLLGLLVRACLPVFAVCRAPPRAPCCSPPRCTGIAFRSHPSRRCPLLLLPVQCAFCVLLDGERLGSGVRAPCFEPRLVPASGARVRATRGLRGAGFGRGERSETGCARNPLLQLAYMTAYPSPSAPAPSSLSHRRPFTTSTPHRPFPRFPHSRQPPPHVNHLCRTSTKRMTPSRYCHGGALSSR